MTHVKTQSEHWDEVKELLREVNPAKKLAVLFANTGMEEIPLNDVVLHLALLRLKRMNKDYEDFLEEFTFSSAGPFPFSDELSDSLPRLAMAREIKIPNPEYNKIIISEERREMLKEKQQVWLPAREDKELEEMGKKFEKLLSEELDKKE